MELSFSEIKKRLSKKKSNLPSKELTNLILSTKNLTLKLLDKLIDKTFTGFERNDYLGKSKSNAPSAGLNPMLWEFGHIAFFYEYHVTRHLNKYKPLEGYTFPLYKDYDIMKSVYDSFLIPRESRFHEQLMNIKEVTEYYLKNINFCIEWFKTYNSDCISTYLILLGTLHNEMHNESFIFTRQLLSLPGPKCFTYNKTKGINQITKLEYVTIKGGTFIQGASKTDLISFDNELPQFLNELRSFKISQTCVSQKMYKEFIENGGYACRLLWCNEGWRWKEKQNITHPIYWFKKEDKWYRKYFDTLIELEDDYPVVNISWYEAKAYSKWVGGRLPTEAEWEYVATNNGKTFSPALNSKYNLDYQNGDVVPIDLYPEGDTGHFHPNSRGVIQMIGNVWEWCEDSFYPYDGFIIDPVYREFSYPFFGYKKILRGGSWTVPNILIHSRYRNAQAPDCQYQYTGIRVVKEINPPI
ncbi:Sulfatase-modifying factor enzyme 1 [seawater metagenome]|uniref:Sulfatase-modifying factor enzyme 1 n=1 Tax=seawater metagenome TaxID=1561972 RepID=A0A5E8CM35_9ZZZZ